jgi:two-component system chemotaxis response regulator CheV
VASILDSVDQRTKLAGHNRLELLMFHLGGKQVFGINVFKVQEVIQCPPLTKVPNAHPVVRGIANMRGKTITVMDLAMCVGKKPIDGENAFVIITEYNRKVQGFMVSMVDRIINVNWDQILPPPKATGKGSYMTAVTEIENELVEIIDVEKVMAEVAGTEEAISDEITEAIGKSHKVVNKIMVVDDSSVARNQIKRTLDQMDYECVMAKNGAQALQMLKDWSKAGVLDDEISMIISDVEMPEMDGYTLATEIRRDPKLAHLYILLHTSLSGVFNNAMVEQVGADRFIAKFNPDELANGVMAALEDVQSRSSAA